MPWSTWEEHIGSSTESAHVIRELIVLLYQLPLMVSTVQRKQWHQITVRVMRWVVASSKENQVSGAAQVQRNAMFSWHQ